MKRNRIITFIDDGTYQDNESYLTGPVSRSMEKLTKDTAKKSLFSIWGVGGVAKGLLSAYPAGKLLILRNAGVDILSERESSNYRFTPGHPRSGECYAVHPLNANAYFPLSDYHRAIFESKTCELISLLMHLGATKIEVQHKNGWGSEFSSSLSIGIPQADEAVEVDASIDGKGSHSNDILFEAKFRGNENPCLPDETVWYEFEPTWKQMAEARIKFGSQQFKLTLDYSDDFGVNAELAAKIDKAGGKISGNFSNHKSTSWVVKGEFA